MKRVFGPFLGFPIMEAPAGVTSKRLDAYIDSSGLDIVVTEGYRRRKTKFKWDQVVALAENGTLVLVLNQERCVLKARKPEKHVAEIERWKRRAEQRAEKLAAMQAKIRRSLNLRKMDPQDTFERSGVLFRVENVKVIGPNEDIPEDQDFRFVKDGPHLVRRSFDPPAENLTELFPHLVPVAGIRFEDRAVTCDIFIHGKDRRLELVPSPFEEHPEAIKVIGHWRDALASNNNGVLGWVPRRYAEQITVSGFHVSSLVAIPVSMYQSRPKRSPGIRMKIWRPYKRQPRSRQAH